MIRHKKGFTLIELMVSVALMLILVGAVIMVFSSSTDVFTSAEAKMTIHQNARVAMELISRELSSATNSVQDANFTTAFANANYICITPDPTDEVMYFTTTCFRGGEVGTAYVRYRVRQITGVTVGGTSTLWKLIREVHYLDGAVVAAKSPETGMLTQYIISPPGTTTRPDISVEAITWNSGAWQRANSLAATTTLPSAVRITMSLTDRQGRAVRTFSRTVWIPSASN